MQWLTMCNKGIDLICDDQSPSPRFAAIHATHRRVRLATGTAKGTEVMFTHEHLRAGIAGRPENLQTN